MQFGSARSTTEARKSRHLDICLEEDVASSLDAGFRRLRLRHEALPDFSLADVEIATTFLGHALGAPLLISSMTGGTERARSINRNLAQAAERNGVALALGSQRAALENRALLETYAVRDVAPSVLLFANLGAVQLNYGVTPHDARRMVEAIGADGLYLATGHEGLGITTSLGTARLLADQVLGRAPAIPVEPYLPARAARGVVHV